MTAKETVVLCQKNARSDPDKMYWGNAYSDTRQCSRSTNHGIQPGYHAIQVTVAEAEVARVRGRFRLHPLDQYAQDPSRTRTDSQGWNEDTRRDFDTEGDYGQPPLDDKSNKEGNDNGYRLRGGIKDAETRLVPRLAVFEKLVYEFCATHFGVGVYESEDSGDRGNL